MLKNIGLPEILVILLVILIFFGPEYLKTLAKQLGLAGKELKNIDKEYKETVSEISNEKIVTNNKNKKKGVKNK
ncbi:twin-arginine translocase TatA/TatE family subunit [Candidatus Roizmanbacteria bacterium CG_4_10_14_0_2_um_filter_39_12]|nr:MAG: twin-arginine translocase TatA/TatE family subunit [Candidatus Roizmanbacteria bacterium CG_4_10_14_0_2_um_filter_39_12]